MTRFIALSPHEFRCRPVPPFTSRHNDCGRQGNCARALAANTVGAPQDDLSREAKVFYGAMMTCPHFLSISDAARYVSRPAVKEWK